MPDNDPNTPKVDDNPVYQAILGKLKEQDEVIATLRKTVTDVTEFNKQLLSRSPDSNTGDNTRSAIDKLDAYINEN